MNISLILLQPGKLFPALKPSVLVMALAAVFPALQAGAATYWVDPVSGEMSNPGTSTSPWSTLEAVFGAKKTFAPGDVILLRTGYHGSPRITGKNSGTVTIKPDTGAKPLLRKLNVETAARWVISGVSVSPAHAGKDLYDSGTLAGIQADCSYITLDGCSIAGAEDTSRWSERDWATRLGFALNVKGAYSTVKNTSLFNVGFGINISKTAVGSIVSRTTIKNFSNDGIRALADNCLYEYNTITNCHTRDSNHDDAFQSWSTDKNGKVGKGTVYNVTVRGNVFISWTDAKQPHKSTMQGIGNFDGMFENWVVENNLIVTDQWHGIALYGAKNCRITNNTVVSNPIHTFSGVPWIFVSNHKSGKKSTGNVIRNNLTTKVKYSGGSSTVDHNIQTRDYTSFFTDYAKFDFTLRPTAPAVGKGVSTRAPGIDIDGLIRSLPFDVGAYEYTVEEKPPEEPPPVDLPEEPSEEPPPADPSEEPSEEPPGEPSVDLIAYEGFNYPVTENISTLPASATGIGWTDEPWSGGNNVISPGLTAPSLPVEGNALQFGGNLRSERSIDPDAMPETHSVINSDGAKRLGKQGSTLWISLLLRPEEGDPEGTAASVNFLGEVKGGTSKLSIGELGALKNWAVGKGGSSFSSDEPIVQNRTTRLVARIRFREAGYNDEKYNDEVDLFIDPPAGPVEPVTPSVQMRGLEVGAFDRLEFRGNRRTSADELAIGATWESVNGLSE